MEPRLERPRAVSKEIMNTRPRMRGALIGCGNVSRHHLLGWTKVPGASIEALCELDPARLATARSSVAAEARFREAATMFTAIPLDFVEICTGPETHLGLVALAASHRVHVLCQKPASLVREDLVAMIEACRAAGVRLMIHENWRFRPWYRAMKSVIESGAIGRPIRLRIAHRDTRALRREGFAEQPFLESRPRLILMEMGCHLVDTARFLFGEIARVTAQTWRSGRGHPGEDVASLLLDFETGAAGLLDMSWCAHPTIARPEWALNETAVEGTDGLLELQDDGSLRLRDNAGATRLINVPLPPFDEVYVDAYVRTQAHFIEGLVPGAAHETDGSDTLRTMDAVWAAYRSAEEGRCVSL